MAKANAGIQDSKNDPEDDGARISASRRSKTSHPTANPMVRHSNGGVSRICCDKAGHVAHSGIDRPPMRVQIHGFTGGAWRPKRDLNISKVIAVLALTEG